MRAPTLVVLSLLAACARELTPRSVLSPGDLRVLALLASPLDLGPDEGIALRAVTWPDRSALDGERWTFCPFSAGASAGYACAVTLPECEVDLAVDGAGNATARPADLALRCLEALRGAGGIPPGLPPQLPERLDLVFRYLAVAGGNAREAVQIVPLYPGGPPSPRNLPPAFLGVAIGGQPVGEGDSTAPLPSGAEVEVTAVLDPLSAQPYLGAAGQPLVESLVVSFYATAGRFDFDRALGPVARVKLRAEKLEPGQVEAQVWAVARDLRGGETVAGPFRVPIAP